MNYAMIRSVFAVIALFLMGFIGQLFAQGQTIGTPKKCITAEGRDLFYQLHPEIAERAALNEMRKVDSLPDTLDQAFVIPVVVHVMYDNGGPETQIDLNLVQSQIDVLNEDYGRYGNGANTHDDGMDAKITFCLAKKDPNGEPTTGLNFVYYPPTVDVDPFTVTEDTLMKRVVQWDPNRYLNIWVVRRIANNGLYGYSFLPNEVAGTIYDGVVIGYRFFGRQGGGVYGRTGTHETGHFLGLKHTWGDGDCSKDDEVKDTPLCSGAYYSPQPACDQPVQCGSVRQIQNYMDYSDDACMNMFTRGQIERMRKMIYLYRPQLVSAQNAALTGCGNALDSLPTQETLTIYPNPAGNYFWIYADYAEEELTDIRIVDAAGRIVADYKEVYLGRGPYWVDLSTSNQGLYQVIVRSKTRYFRKNLVVLD